LPADSKTTVSLCIYAPEKSEESRNVL
jgi:hypothetical protein